MPPKSNFDKLLTSFLEVALNDIKDLREEINKLKTTNKDMTTTMNTLTTENVTLTKELDALKRRLQLSDGLVSQLRSKGEMPGG
jgi:regulator of replication initiation timing